MGNIFFLFLGATISLACLSVLLILKLDSAKETNLDSFKDNLRKESLQINIKRRKEQPTILYVVIKRLIDIFAAISLIMSMAPLMTLLAIKGISENNCTTFKKKVVLGYDKKPINIERFNLDNIIEKDPLFKTKSKAYKNFISNTPILFSLLSGSVSLVGLSISSYNNSNNKSAEVYKYAKPGILSISTIVKDIPENSANRVYLDKRSIKLDVMIMKTALKEVL